MTSLHQRVEELKRFDLDQPSLHIKFKFCDIVPSNWFGQLEADAITYKLKGMSFVGVTSFPA
jgi:hypothetical protein